MKAKSWKEVDIVKLESLRMIAEILAGINLKDGDMSLEKFRKVEMDYINEKVKMDIR